jgi:hypothetical protein
MAVAAARCGPTTAAARCGPTTRRR